jgi:hypothetical protein
MEVLQIPGLRLPHAGRVLPLVHDGMRPHRIRSSRRLPSWSSIVSIVVVGQTLKRGWKLCGAGPSVSRYNAIISSQVSL